MSNHCALAVPNVALAVPNITRPWPAVPNVTLAQR
jgi:hypothetical protein